MFDYRESLKIRGIQPGINQGRRERIPAILGTAIDKIIGGGASHGGGVVVTLRQVRGAVGMGAPMRGVQGTGAGGHAAVGGLRGPGEFLRGADNRAVVFVGEVGHTDLLIILIPREADQIAGKGAGGFRGLDVEVFPQTLGRDGVALVVNVVGEVALEGAVVLIDPHGDQVLRGIGEVKGERDQTCAGPVRTHEQVGIHIGKEPLYRVAVGIRDD